jgi:hypothetical protein
VEFLVEMCTVCLITLYCVANLNIYIDSLYLFQYNKRIKMFTIFHITLHEGLNSNTEWQFCYIKRISCRIIDSITVYLREKEFCVVHEYLGVRVFLPLLKLRKVNLKINQMSGSLISTTSNNMKGFVFRPKPHD